MPRTFFADPEIFWSDPSLIDLWFLGYDNGIVLFFWRPSWILDAILEMVGWIWKNLSHHHDLVSRMCLSDFRNVYFDYRHLICWFLSFTTRFCTLAAILNFGRHLENGSLESYIISRICLSDPRNPYFDTLLVNFWLVHQDHIFQAAILDFGRHLENDSAELYLMSRINLSDPTNPQFDTSFVNLRLLQQDHISRAAILDFGRHLEK